MFEGLFTDGSAVKSYRTAPLLAERLRYLEHLSQTGARPYTLCRIAANQVDLVRLLDLRDGDRVDAARIEAAAEQWLTPEGRRIRRAAGKHAKRRFIGGMARWLRFAGMLVQAPPEPRHAHDGEVETFAGWLRTECGWSDSTIRACCNPVNQFLDRLEELGIPLSAVRIGDIDAQVARWHAGGLARITVNGYSSRLRAFLRFAEGRDWCATGLADGVVPPRFRPDESIPKGLDRDEVLRLLATTEGDRPADIRDRAILMLLITYGLRAGEVAGLRLDDLDWRGQRLQARCPKPGRTSHCPLSPGVGNSILRYLTEVRSPPGSERDLFLTVRAPVRPVTAQAIGLIVRNRADLIGIVGKRRGSHSLRHATAQRLLDHGLSMKQVGDYLGHRGAASTAVYAKVRLGALREVARIDLEGLA